MSKEPPPDCAALIAEIDTALASASAARLTERQYADVRALREEVETLCGKGDGEAARAAVERALAIVKEGPPTR